MDFSVILGGTNLALIGAIIVLLESIKRGIEAVLKRPTAKWIWKLAVIVAGVGAAIIAGAYKDWRSFLSAVIIYPAAATIVYQTGKLAIETVLKKEI